MPWIESHTELDRKPKFKALTRDLRLRPAYTKGHLHCLWHAALEVAEDGDLSKWTNEDIAEASDYPGDAAELVRLLQEHRWLDDRLLHDWLEYAGAYLRGRYKTRHRERLVAIWAKHGKVYNEAGRGGKTNKSENLDETSRDLPANFPLTSHRTDRPTEPTDRPTCSTKPTGPAVITTLPVRASPSKENGKKDIWAVLGLEWRVKGEHYGREIQQLPLDYVRWALAELTEIGDEYRRGLRFIVNANNGSTDEARRLDDIA